MRAPQILQTLGISTEAIKLHKCEFLLWDFQDSDTSL